MTIRPALRGIVRSPSGTWQEVAPYSSRRQSREFACLRGRRGALHLAFFEQPGKDDLFSSFLEHA